jgi:chemotaxis protein methyltransferase CheR
MIFKKLASENHHGEIEIIGSDLNHAYLETARTGVYNSRSLRNAPPDACQQYFQSSGSQDFLLREEIRAMVTFHQFNLVDLSYGHLPAFLPPGGVDFILCRNVLMYFHYERASRIVEQLGRCLAPEGVLVLSACDTKGECESQFQMLPAHGALILQKRQPNTAAATQEHNLPKDRSRSALISNTENDSAHQLPEHKFDRAAQATPTQDDSAPRPHVDQYVAQIRALSNGGSNVEALSCVNEAITNFPLNEILYLSKAFVLQNLHRHEEAADSLQQAIFLNPDLIMAHFSLLTILLRLARIEQARICHRNVLRLLKKHDSNYIVPHSEEMTARQIVNLVSTFALGGTD